ncbi:MAG: restriction endonuclease [Verrucomicrobiia bacterium]|jgi:hypothetical protein
MSRRRRQRKSDPFDLVGPIIALVFILALVARFALGALFEIAAIILVCAIAVSALLFFFWLLAQNERVRPYHLPPYPPLPEKPYPNATWPKADPSIFPTLEEKLRTIDWYQFERVVSAIYEVPGCTVRRLGGAKPDGGIDLMVEQGGRRIIVQCKHWRKWTVGVRHIRELWGAKEIAHADKAVLITLRGCTQDAKDLANQQGIDIIDETGLIKLMQMSDGSIDSKILALLNDTRKFCPKCERPLVVRTAKKGSNYGTQFWGCSNYPRCRYILRNP